MKKPAIITSGMLREIVWGELPVLVSCLRTRAWVLIACQSKVVKGKDHVASTQALTFLFFVTITIVQ